MNYKKLANLYDKLIYDVDYDKMVDFYKTIIEKHNLNNVNVLELGCGTGNITSKLIGYNVYAVDYSEEMLSVAREKLGNRRNIRLINADIRELELNKKFNFIIAGLDIINYIDDNKGLEKVFESVYEHLDSDGVFVFDINSEYKIKDYIGNNIFSDEVEDILYIWQGSFDEDTKINEYLLTFFVKDENDKYDRFSESHFEKAYSTEEIINMLKNVGFENINTYEDYTNKDITDETMRIVFVVSKEEINER